MHIYTYIYIYIYMYEYINRASQVALMVKNTSANAGGIRDTGSIHGSGIYPRGGYSNPLQYIYCLFIFSIRIFIQTLFLQIYLGQLVSSHPIQCSYDSFSTQIHFSQPAFYISPHILIFKKISIHKCHFVVYNHIGLTNEYSSSLLFHRPVTCFQNVHFICFYKQPLPPAAGNH